MSKMDGYELDAGCSLAMHGFRDVNSYLTEQEPWKLKGDEHKETRQIVVRATLEAVYALSHLLIPFLPVGTTKIFEKLNVQPQPLQDVNPNLRNMMVGKDVHIGDVLYVKLKSEEELNAEETAKLKKEKFAEAQRLKKEKKAKAIASSKAGQKGNAGGAGNDSNQPEFTKMEIRVGQITKVWLHPNADKLFCEEIDVGEETPRQIASGLRGHYELDQLQNQKVLVVCNLKASKIIGFASSGMVLAAKAEDGSKVELITPPVDAQVGERIFIDGLSGDPSSSAQVKKKKIWDKVAKGLKTGDGGLATWDGKEIKTSAGPCKAESLVGVPIS